MITRPHVLLSAATSLDGYLDDTTGERLVLSTEEDFAEVDRIRAGSDAILVGANTIRADNPRLLVRSPELRRARVEAGKPEQPVKVTITATGELDPDSRFFTTGESEKLVYVPAGVVVPDGVRAVATVVEAGSPVDLREVLRDLAERGIGRLMVEGGGRIHTWFLGEGLVDELRLAIAPVFVGDSRAPRFVGPGSFPRNLTVAGTRQFGDLVVLSYHTTPEPSEADVRRLRQAVALADLCPPSATFRVGAVITDADDVVLATGHSGEGDPKNHAEEAALAKLDPADPRLATATIYSSLEPCSTRSSRRRTCTKLILDAAIPRIVFAWREPEQFVDCIGAELLEKAGRRVIEIPALAAGVRRANTHLSGVRP
ncbi:dihydrofolate reductase family protein [Amycolatopsis sp. H20-H5]|uniref:dihydrofolate reductase family protein n=1 Tax=Amycolatopsis sp. H20-H5 TaxID=3046309 RepID=UPI002DBA53DA|nr:dihydrofolate reductase family protein [Amycolatopsis sp. H20-H5]MEC3977589.1 dihydrofolate reductase family protein [Amycolatopsis sp. H20-H5]